MVSASGGTRAVSHEPVAAPDLPRASRLGWLLALLSPLGAALFEYCSLASRSARIGVELNQRSDQQACEIRRKQWPRKRKANAPYKRRNAPILSPVPSC